MYELAAKISTLAESGKGYKNVLYANKNRKIVKSAYFLSKTAIRKRSVIDELLKSVGLWDEAKNVIWLARVGVTQLLWGRSPIPKNVPIFKKLVQRRDQFRKLLPVIEESVDTEDNLKIPRYIRVNTAVYSKDSAITFLKEKGFSQLQCPSTYNAYLNTLKTLKANEFLFDIHVPNLMVFSNEANIAKLSEVDFIRQDKSSCLVPVILAPMPGSDILDMCAAPGYKTQHTASLVDKKGRIYSVEINKNRYQILQETSIKFGLEDVCVPLNMDALKVTSKTCPDIEYIILDPPCSGTGMANVLIKHTADVNRLKKLRNLQAMLLKHALSNFPCVRRVVYSTCSVMEEENEIVVSECLDVAEKNGFKLVPLNSAFRSAFRTGVGSSECTSFVLRVFPEKDLTNGFFVALFERSVPPKAPSWELPLPSCNKNIMETLYIDSEELSSQEEPAYETEAIHNKRIKNTLKENKTLTEKNNILNVLSSTTDSNTPAKHKSIVTKKSEKNKKTSKSSYNLFKVTAIRE